MSFSRYLPPRPGQCARGITVGLTAQPLAAVSLAKALAHYNDFETTICAAIGWNNLGDLRQYTSTETLREAYIHHLGNAKPAKTVNAIAMIRKFGDDIQQGDLLITYSQEHREYLVGEDQGQHGFCSEQELVGEFANIRKVKWLGRISRDLLT